MCHQVVDEIRVVILGEHGPLYLTDCRWQNVDPVLC